MNNIGLKFLALIITLIMYFFVNSQSNQGELTLTVPLKFKNLPTNKFILLPVSRQVQVTLRGPVHKLAEIGSSLYFDIDLPSKIENKHQVALSSQHLNLPPGLEAYNISPSNLDLILDDIVTKLVKIDVLTIGQLNDYIKLIGIKTEPPRIEILGPASEVGLIDSVETVPVDLRSKEESGQLVADLKLPSPSIQLKTDRVLVNYDLTRLYAEKIYQDVPIEVRSVGRVLAKISPAYIQIELSGPTGQIKELDAEDLKPYVRVSRQQLSSELEVQIDLPQDVKLIKMEPQKVQILDGTVKFKK